MKLNDYCRGKIIIPNRIFFGGGYPKFKLIPSLAKWGDTLSIFWLGAELCLRRK